jgi:hypothetical protein
MGSGEDYETSVEAIRHDWEPDPISPEQLLHEFKQEILCEARADMLDMQVHLEASPFGLTVSIDLHGARLFSSNLDWNELEKYKPHSIATPYGTKEPYAAEPLTATWKAGESFSLLDTEAKF